MRLAAVATTLVLVLLVLLGSGRRIVPLGPVTFEARAGKDAKEAAQQQEPISSVSSVSSTSTASFASSVRPSVSVAPATIARPTSGILYVLRSGHQNYKTRLPVVMETWGQEVNSTLADGLIMVGDSAWPSHKPPIIPAKICGNDHSRELCCKTGYALMMAAEHLEEFSWFFVVDDDMYVHLENAERVLSKYNPHELIALGIPGCGPGFCRDRKGGFCGGGGYAISRASLRKLMTGSAEGFHKDLMKNLAQEKSGQAWDDISVSCSLKRNGIKLLLIKGLHGWRIEGKGKPLNFGYEKAIRSKDPLPITFHYLSPDMMRAIHTRFKALKAGKRLLGLGIRHEYDKQLKKYLVNMTQRA